MKILTISIGLLCLSLVAQSQNSKNEADVKARMDSFIASFNQGTEKIVSHVANDFHYRSGNNDFIGPVEYAKVLDSHKWTNSEITVNKEVIFAGKDLAIVEQYYSLKLEYKDAPNYESPKDSYSVFIWVKNNGEWFIRNYIQGAPPSN